MSFLLCRHEWKAESIPFLIEWGLFTNFGKHLFFIAAGSLLIHFRNIQVPRNGQNSGFACDFSHRRNLTRQRSYHSRYQTKGCLIAGILNSVTWCFRRWISGSTHSLISVSAFAIILFINNANACNPLRNEKLSVGF